MAKFILIKAPMNSGKTTTTSLVYSELLKHANQDHIFNGNEVKINSLMYRDDGSVFDFCAILTIDDKTVAILSAGDVASDFIDAIDWLLSEFDCDVIICCSRSQNKGGSVYRTLLENYLPNNELILQTSPSYSSDPKQKTSIKKDIVDLIVNKVLETVKDGELEVI